MIHAHDLNDFESLLQTYTGYKPHDTSNSGKMPPQERSLLYWLDNHHAESPHSNRFQGITAVFLNESSILRKLAENGKSIDVLV